MDFHWHKGIEEYIDALASDNATPGGGSAAAASGAIGCALAIMAMRVTAKLKATDPNIIPALNNVSAEVETAENTLKKFTLEDSAAYQNYINLKKEQKTNPEISLDNAITDMAIVPVNTALECIKVLKTLDNVKNGISPVIASDMLCGQHMLFCTIRCCMEMMRTNLPFVKVDAVITLLAQTIEHCEQFLEATPECPKQPEL
ncbi:Methenyl tetrahydrofolate cyclohydrolase-like protein [Elusimicrobium minutum Pei191]|uniref:Methenyl tetrahydrofolate cyclohydrolase-like protein n=1 Tax=Elusimicrobium minutum (strain Pei191) TaxID=445932 RepID=B2KE44_ELUMP|nr:cyclodeaminase/cyclohydrolase family protein [Elusimicrobium minutum]ACC98790.1 Methenyl tetrahydrofolate cyclohydrolase-like protein [Elusimicrobium minutum Pei191]